MKDEDRRIYITDEIVEHGFQRCLEGEDNIAQAATLERKGGPCPFCGVPFNKVDVDNRYGKFSYYQPSCRCFKRCDWVQFPSGPVVGCGRWLIAERIVGINFCTSCTPPKDDKKDQAAKKNGKVLARKRIGKDAAAGD
ncbi:MAG: hypothetical protein WC455_13675 [Dehalococcoidia bacterium]